MQHHVLSMGWSGQTHSALLAKNNTISDLVGGGDVTLTRERDIWGNKRSNQTKYSLAKYTIKIEAMFEELYMQVLFLLFKEATVKSCSNSKVKLVYCRWSKFYFIQITECISSKSMRNLNARSAIPVCRKKKEKEKLLPALHSLHTP